MTTQNIILHGRRLDSPHSPSLEVTLTILRLRDQELTAPPDYERDAQELMLWFGRHASPAMMAVLGWDRDAVREVQRLRALNESLAARLAAASEVLGRCAERGKIATEDVNRLVGEARKAVIPCDSNQTTPE